MGIVVITGDGPEHRFVANRLVASGDVKAILVCDPPARRSVRVVLRSSPLRFVDKAARRVLLAAIGDARARHAALVAALGPEAESFSRPDLIRRVGRPKDGKLKAAVAELRPEIIAVYGTGIIPDDVLGQARMIALNMHTGLSPQYRGVACAYWPLADGRPEMVGATVHECVSSVDGGQVFFQARARLDAGDSLHTVFARAVLVGAEGYGKVVSDALAGTLEGQPQALEEGREYRGRDLGLLSEIRFRLMHAWLSRRGKLTQPPFRQSE